MKGFRLWLSVMFLTGSFKLIKEDEMTVAYLEAMATVCKEMKEIV